MGGWYSPPILAADPTSTGNVLVAVLQKVLSPTAASYDTSANPVAADRGLGLNADGSELFAVTSTGADYALNIFPGTPRVWWRLDSPQILLSGLSLSFNPISGHIHA
jgi:hypothetical protein